MGTHFVKKLLTLVSWIVASGTFAVTAPADIYRDALSKRLDFIFRDSSLKKTQVGVEVYSLSRQESLYSLNASRPLAPASAIKLLTAYVALRRLGQDFTFKTEALATGSISGGVLRGDLCLRGGGDPSLVTERLQMLVAELMRSDVREVTGNICVDDSAFDEIRIDPKRIPTDTDRPYNAPVGALSFNYNTTTVYFRPAESAGGKARVFVEPDTGFVELVNQTKTGARGSKYTLTASRVQADGHDKLVVRGSMPLGMAEQRSYFNITDPARYAGFALRSFLEARGVKVRGREIRNTNVPPSARLLATLESFPLREIVVLMNKFSNNFIADTLVKTLSRELRGAPGNMKSGLEVLREEANQIGMNTAGFNVVSGSGLTRENKVSPAQFTKLLNASYLEFDVLPELLSSLPIAGKDGTLKRRMKGSAAYGRLRGKTGSIDGVSALVGLVQSRGGELLAFSVLMNDQSKSPGAMRPWQNYFGQALADFNRKTPLSETPPATPAVLNEPTDGEEQNVVPQG